MRLLPVTVASQATKSYCLGRRAAKSTRSAGAGMVISSALPLVVLDPQKGMIVRVQPHQHHLTSIDLKFEFVVANTALSRNVVQQQRSAICAPNSSNRHKIRHITMLVNVRLVYALFRVTNLNCKSPASLRLARDLNEIPVTRTWDQLVAPPSPFFLLSGSVSVS